MPHACARARAPARDARARAEQSDAKRTIGELLRALHGAQSRAMRRAPRATARQWSAPRALAPPARALQTEDEVVALVADGTERRVRELAAADVPAFVGKLVRERFRARAVGPSKEVLRVVKAKTPRQPFFAGRGVDDERTFGRRTPRRRIRRDRRDRRDTAVRAPPRGGRAARDALRDGALREAAHRRGAASRARRDARRACAAARRPDRRRARAGSRRSGRRPRVALTLTRVTHDAARASRRPTYGIRTVCTVARDAAADAVAQP